MKRIIRVLRYIASNWLKILLSAFMLIPLFHWGVMGGGASMVIMLILWIMWEREIVGE